MRHKHSVTEDPVTLAGVTAIAAAIGAGVALLFTPRNGQQVRRGLKRRAHHLTEDLHNRFDDAVDTVGDTAEDTKEQLQATAEKAVTKTKTAATKAKTAAKDTKQPPAK